MVIELSTALEQHRFADIKQMTDFIADQIREKGYLLIINVVYIPSDIEERIEQ